jgi:riboflavin synthase
MFTGLVESVGRIASIEEKAQGMRMRFLAPGILGDQKEGDSICVSGVCLTALDIRDGSFAADLAPETLARTSLGQLGVGSGVNLERALLASARLGGHIMQGHVDGVARVVEITQLGDGNWWVGVELPAELERYVVHKGSIALDGISLTVAQVEGRRVSVAIIPHTWRETTLCERGVGDAVNVEVDVVAKYVERLASFAGLRR